MNSSGSTFWSSGSVPLIDASVLSSIIAVASDIALVVSKDGEVLSVLVNPNETSFGKLEHWEGRPLKNFLTKECIPKIDAVMSKMASGELPSRSVELNHSDNAVWEFPVRYSFHPFGSDGSFLMLGRDLRPIAETQQQLVQAQMSLEQGYEARREYDARYRLLLRTVQDPVVFVSVNDGKIKDLNEPAAMMLGSTREDLVGSSFTQEFRDKRGDEFIEALINEAMSENTTGVDVQSRRGRQQVSVVPSVFRAGGERILICRLSTSESSPKRFDSLTTNLSSVFEKGPDAFVFTSVRGVIEACNDAFLDLVDAAHSVDVRGRNLSDYLGRGQIDLSVLVENARRAGQMRMYSTKVLNEFGAKTPVEMSVTFLENHNEPELGFIIRDISRVDAMRKTQVHSSEESNRNVMELVGSATLKEIVSETTDVVEKMCIETAVSLTRNNRVAAAEMLGLSRQSLYVKLRKYGLLNKDSDGN
ncbi:transcriptional regulator PpsR [Marivita sp. S0852]|uniref:transcriptional regulator PpsR n=1 Tax=Marivita sp. S0852 TaxID=3373893 RepID=UPI003981CE9F